MGEAAASQAAAAAAECASVTGKSSVLERTAGLWSGVVRSALLDDEDDDFLQNFNSFSKQTIRRLPNARVSDSSTMSACYLSSSLPGLLDMIAKYSTSSQNVWKGLLANANVGGENVHRGSVMGAILGARAKDSDLPEHLKKGLYHHAELAHEIDDFVQAVLYTTDDDHSARKDMNES